MSVKTKEMKYSSQEKALSLDLFKSSLEELPKNNRWVKLGDSLPWDKIEKIYNARLNNRHGGAGNKPARMIVGSLLIKHKMCLSDVETIEAIRENPYMQYMLGLSEFTDKPVFDPSLFVAIRKRIGVDDFNDMSESLLKLQVRIQEEKEQKDKDNDDTQTPSDSGKTGVPEDSHPAGSADRKFEGLLKIDATCSDAEVRYPTDLDLVHDGVEVVDRIIERMCKNGGISKPNTHIKEIHSFYLNVIKLRNKSGKKIRDCMEYLLTWLYRDIKECLDLVGSHTIALFDTLKQHDRQLFATVLRMFHQQKEMFKNGTHRCTDRIISIFQPHVRPIVRGKAKAKVEFGAKIGASIVKGYTFIDHHSWDAYNECDDLILHLRNYKQRFGVLPKKVEADKIYLNRKNRRILKFLKIEIGGKSLGRPSKEQQTPEYRELMSKNVGERNEIEATFGTGKKVYRANDIRAKLPDTGASWNSACYFTKNVMKFLRELLYALILMWQVLKSWSSLVGNFENQEKLTARTLMLTPNR